MELGAACGNEYRDLLRTGITHRWLLRNNRTKHLPFVCEDRNDYCDLDVEGGLLDVDYITSFEEAVRVRSAAKPIGSRQAQHFEASFDNTHMKVYLDVGAHGGYHSLYAARMGYQVVAVEPLPGPRALLRFNLCMNDFLASSITTVSHFALGHANYSCCLRRTNAGECYSSLSISNNSMLHATGEATTHAPLIEEKFSDDDRALRAKCAARGGEFVRYRILDDFRIPFLNLVKIDAGYKTLQALAGASATLAQRYDERMNVYLLGFVLVRVPLVQVEDVIFYLWNSGFNVFATNFLADQISTLAQLEELLVVPPLSSEQLDDARTRAQLLRAPHRTLFALKREMSDAVVHLNSLVESTSAAARATANRFTSLNFGA